MLKYAYYLLISLVLVFFSQSIFSAFIAPENLNILLVFLVFITFVWGFDLGFIFAVFIGFLLNLYSYLPLGSYIVIFLLIILLVDFLHRQIFINFTFSTNIILILISTLAYSILLVGVNFIFYFLGITRIYINLDGIFLTNLFQQIISNLVLICLIFICAKAIFKKLNLAILVKR
jgi:rod shape-determining protein MreD